VDDNEDVATSAVDLLRLVGFDARACFDGPAALACAVEFRPHACVLDINMPRMDGYELARRLRALLGSVYLIAVSAAFGPDHDRRMAASDFQLHLVKPADPAGLIGVLARLVV
jgi:CheY-like chemotaxis protein